MAVTLSLEDTQRLAKLVTEYGSLDALVEALGKRQKNGKMSTSEAIKAYELKIITRVEARKLLGMRVKR